MKGFNFEKNLEHQTNAVNSTITVFDNLKFNKINTIDKQFINPEINLIESKFQFLKNVEQICEHNSIKEKAKYSNIIDIMMETGTGKTYTYTKTIFELNKIYGIFKFIIVVPTLPIKAGTINFLKSNTTREHFKEDYGKTIKLHIVESQKNNKNKKSYIPSSISSFTNSGSYESNQIQVLIINAGMINSDTMNKSFDKSLLDKYQVPFDAISATKPFLIIDEPHKFTQENKTWTNVEKLNAQFILRYGATFPEKEIKTNNELGKLIKIKIKDYHNLVYTLSAVDSFNKNLVKGVIGHISEFEDGKKIYIKLINSDSHEATFELFENSKKKTFKVSKKESLEKIHSEMSNLFVENLNKTTVILSNGLELKKGMSINPFSYSQTLQESMIKKAIKEHFELEKDFLTRDVKIKPLTLFFIDNIEEYRNEDGELKRIVEECIKVEIKELLKTEQNSDYKNYLEKTLEDVSMSHGGYFSKDNSDKDEVIEKEVNEILHDKEAILDLKNPRRFIFSKWTLREGWDNPNVFQICKLRSSGSEISKLQEVGRGLRLPVNEYGNRVKDEQFYLNYFVDFTENDFVDKLVTEINQKSGAFSIDDQNIQNELSKEMIRKICELYNKNQEDLLDLLDSNNIITRSNKFKEGGFNYIKDNFPLIFEGVNKNKVRIKTDLRKKITIRTEKYNELKDLWEKLNQKVILEYKIKNETHFKDIFLNFLNERKDIFEENIIKNKKSTFEIEQDRAILRESTSAYGNKKNLSTMKYIDFLQLISKELNMNLKSVHQTFIESKLDINNYLNHITIRNIKSKFEEYLMYNALGKFEIEYQKVSNEIHPTKLTDTKGNILDQFDNSSEIGIISSEEKVAENYLFNELFYDSELEKENIINKVDEVIVFTKIPKNSIKIPISGGKSYSPDFAYVLKSKEKVEKIYFIVETKNVGDENQLREEEKIKIKHAEKFFGDTIKITFKKQFSNKRMADLISNIINLN